MRMRSRAFSRFSSVMTDAMKIIENGLDWFLFDDVALNDLPKFCTKCSHKMLHFKLDDSAPFDRARYERKRKVIAASAADADADADADAEMEAESCNSCFSRSWPTASTWPKARVRLSLSHSSNSISPLIFQDERKYITLCYACDYVYLGSRICPLCKAHITKQTSDHLTDRTFSTSPVTTSSSDVLARSNDYCKECYLKTGTDPANEGRCLKQVIDEVRLITNRRCSVCSKAEYEHEESQKYAVLKHTFRCNFITF